jgi:hypothetical protein
VPTLLRCVLRLRCAPLLRRVCVPPSDALALRSTDWGLRVRGQHTKTTGRRGRTVGVSKKR